MAPAHEVDLMNMLRTSHAIDDRPTALRYPRGNGYGVEKLNELFGLGLTELPEKGEVLEVGKGLIVRPAGGRAPADALAGDASLASHEESVKKRTRKVALLTLGTRCEPALQAAAALEDVRDDVGVTVADARFMKPLDIDLVRELASSHEILVTVEEGSIGGFGDHVLHFLANDGALDAGKLKVRARGASGRPAARWRSSAA